MEKVENVVEVEMENEQEVEVVDKKLTFADWAKANAKKLAIGALALTAVAVGGFVALKKLSEGEAEEACETIEAVADVIETVEA